jgi:hypothetical protein
MEDNPYYEVAIQLLLSLIVNWGETHKENELAGVTSQTSER